METEVKQESLQETAPLIQPKEEQRKAKKTKAAPRVSKDERYENITVAEKKMMSKDERDDYIAWKRARDNEIVEGVFKFFECPGGRLDFIYKLPYKGEKIHSYTMFDGQTYQIPRGVANHLNDDCWYPEYGHLDGNKDVKAAQGELTNVYRKRKVNRVGFFSNDLSSVKTVTVQDLSL